ncbi:MAG: DNA polymerase III subunit chi [Erythrobacter sp.]|jgi:DNA polymerase-3 subunit chi|nr:DNA polymerase III subunit chi [Erythrobacter sp.]
MKLDFWQLSRDPAEKVVAAIAARVLDSGERVLVVSADEAQRAAISKALWGATAESFLANGEAGGEDDARQPVLLSAKLTDANRASHVIYADGAFREPSGFARAFLLFDESTLESARTTWKALGDRDGMERAFYRQERGNWVLVA